MDKCIDITMDGQTDRNDIMMTVSIRPGMVDE